MSSVEKKIVSEQMRRGMSGVLKKMSCIESIIKKSVEKKKWFSTLLMLIFSSQAIANPCPPICEMHVDIQKKVETQVHAEDSSPSSCHDDKKNHSEPFDGRGPCPVDCMTLSWMDVSQVSSLLTFVESRKCFEIVYFFADEDDSLVRYVLGLYSSSPPYRSRQPIYLSTRRLRV